MPGLRLGSQPAEPLFSAAFIIRHQMGAGASVPDVIDEATAKGLAGEQWNQELFDAQKDADGKITKAQFEEQRAAAAPADSATAEGTTVPINAAATDDPADTNGGTPDDTKNEAKNAPGNADAAPTEESAEGSDADAAKMADEGKPEDEEEHDEDEDEEIRKKTENREETEDEKDARLWEEFERDTPGIHTHQFLVVHNNRTQQFLVAHAVLTFSAPYHLSLFPGLNEHAMLAKRKQFERQSQQLIDTEKEMVRTKDFNSYTTHNNLKRNTEHADLVTEEEIERLNEVCVHALDDADAAFVIYCEHQYSLPVLIADIYIVR
jgi:hypothetical protein